MRPLQAYIDRLAQEYKTGVTTELSLRQILVEFLKNHPAFQKFTVINEPKRIECGAPDIVLICKEFPIAYIETKDLGDTDLLGSRHNKEQFARYKQSIDIVVFTDFLRFLLYQNGECLFDVRLAEQVGDKLIPVDNAETAFTELLSYLRDAQPSPITSASKLASIMAGKAQLLARSIQTVLGDKQSALCQELTGQLTRMRDVLLNSISEDEFSDWYAQTLIYGLFAARYHAPDIQEFTRETAAKLIPRSNPFLRKIFYYICGIDLDPRLAWIIDDLVSVFSVTDLRTLVDSQKAGEKDPVMLFYEDFLTAYNPVRRKARGVYYTPAPVVEFMVRAVDEILIRDFGMREGLADCSLLPDKSHVHRLQILDPATGTGTFLVEIVRAIHRKFEGRQGVWNDYVRNHLLPRLHGYEILMAPYAMAHLNLEHVLHETGATDFGDARFGIYLANTLEAQHPESNGLFPIDTEANAVNALKRDRHVMVMIGNPPYNVSSCNKNQWIEALMQSYKAGLNEKNIMPLSDDYIKFIRYAQYQIERTGEGVVAFITNNSFLDGVIHRQMRKELLRVFDIIYIVNLHGNSRLKEKTPEGRKDENVFDIQAGVSINIFVKNKETPLQNNLATLYYYEWYGLRKEKLENLHTHNFKKLSWQELQPQPPAYFFVNKDFSVANEYQNGLGLEELFYAYNSGASTSRDELIVHFQPIEVERFLNDCKELSVETFRKKYNQLKDTRNWQIAYAQADARDSSPLCIQHCYRPFDIRFVPYTGKTRGLWAYPCFKTLGVLLHPKNFSLCVTRQVSVQHYSHSFVTRWLLNKGAMSVGDSAYAFPLYKFPAGWDYTPAEIVAGVTREGKPIELELNMRPEILAKISKRIGEPVKGEDVFDYIYGVLHDSEYRTKYFEFLKIEYPRIPYPKDKAEYQRFVRIGGYLRRLHLMDEKLDLPSVATFDLAGSNLVECVRYDETTRRVWINDTQYFGAVPLAVWNHWVGSYQPARLWLQKRIGRMLNYDDVRWYQRVVDTIAEELRFRAAKG